MNESSNIAAGLAETAKLLADESVASIDFDRLIELLHECRDRLKSANDLHHELETLRADYRTRIIGMLKANLACRDDEEESLLAVRLTSNENNIAAEELISLYRKTAARFRENFPSTFKYISSKGDSRSVRKDWSDFKI